MLVQLNRDEFKDLVLTKRIRLIKIYDNSYSIELTNGEFIHYDESIYNLLGLFCDMNEIGYEII